MYPYICPHTHVQKQTCMHSFIRTHCVYVCTDGVFSIHLRNYGHTHTHTYKHRHVCMYLHAHTVYWHAHTVSVYIYMYTCIHIPTRTNTDMCACRCMHTQCIGMHTRCPLTNMHTCIHIYPHVQTYLCMHVPACAHSVPACTRGGITHVKMVCIYANTYTHM